VDELKALVGSIGNLGSAAAAVLCVYAFLRYLGSRDAAQRADNDRVVEMTEKLAQDKGRIIEANTAAMASAKEWIASQLREMRAALDGRLSELIDANRRADRADAALTRVTDREADRAAGYTAAPLVPARPEPPPGSEQVPLG